MERQLPITKMHGLGNDFILVDCRERTLPLADLARSLCRRRLSVGADGILAVCHSDIADICMRIFNADGSEAEMCGNGIRCFARYVYDQNMVPSSSFCVETLAGIIRPQLLFQDNQIVGVKVDMGRPSFCRQDLPMLGEGDSTHARISVLDREVEIGAVLMGVPHTVVLESLPMETFGPAIENHPLFPKKTNVNFVEILSPTCITMSTWERGAGPTLACGTGASGTVALLHRLGLVEEQVEVRLQAGSLWICVEKDRVFMTGPASYTFTGWVSPP